MTKESLKIAFAHNACIEYRLPLFEKLSQDYNVNFYFEWFDSSLSREKPSFKFQFLKSIKISQDYSFSPLLFFHLLLGRYNLFIAGAIGQINTYIAFFVSRLLRKPFIFWDETWYWPCTKLRTLFWPIIIWTLKNAEAIVVPGSKSKDFYLSISAEFNNKIFVAPNASLLPQNQSIANRAEKLKEMLELKNKKVILYCGRLIKQKGLEYLIDAFKIFQKQNINSVLLVVGGQYGCGERYDLQELDVFRDVVGADKIHFTGWVDTMEKAAYFLLADVVVVPSIFFDEGSEVWGFTVNESMSVGKPVVATTAVGAAHDLIQNGINGYVVPDKNSKALFQAINMTIGTSSKQKKMGAQSLRILEKDFTYKNMLLGFKKAMKFVLDSPEIKHRVI